MSEYDREASKGEIMTRRWAEAPLDGKIERKKERKKENKANPRYSPSHTPTYLNAGAVITAFLNH